MLQSPHLNQALVISTPSTGGGRLPVATDRQSSSSDRLKSNTPAVPRSLIKITIEAPQKFHVERGGYYDYKSTTFEIPSAHGPALRSAIDDAKNAIGTQLEKPMPYLREDALTRAASAIGKLFAGICAVIPTADRDYNYSN